MPDFDPNEYLKKQSQSKGFDPNKYLEENTIEKKNLVGNDLPTGSQTSKRGFEPFLPQVPTKTPSVLTPKGQVGYQEQVKDFKPIVQKPIFESPKAKQQRESGYENIAPLLSGLQSTVSSFYKIPRYIYDVFAIPQNLVADLANVPELKANYDNVSKGALNPLSYLEYAGDYAKGKAKEWESKQRKYDEDITTQLFKSGDYGGAALQIYDNVVASAPSIASMFLTGGAAGAAKLGSVSSKIATALPFASAQNQELLDNQDIPDWIKPVNAAFNGLSEILLEGKFGTTAILSGATKIAVEKGADVAAKSIKDFAYNYVKKALSKVQPITDVVSNSMEEMATTLSQNIIARATGEDPNRGIMDGVFDAGIVGGVQGAGASAIRKGLDVLVNKKSKGKVDDLTKKRDDIVNDLDNDAIPDAVKEQLEISLEGINQEINNTLDENRNEINNLPEETKLEVAELADKIETINESLQNETISETSKAILEQDLKDAQAELDAKFKLAKPTFDTEEQIIAEGQQAEAEFKQTGDQVTYEQKMKELDDRANQLIETPTEITEVGKEEINPIDKGKGFDNPDFIAYDGMFSKERASSQSQTDIIADEVQGAKGYHFFYKGKKSRIEMMSPDEYLKRVREGFKTEKDENILESSKAKINEGIEKGDKIDMPSLNYSDGGRFSQEGRNRAVVAKERNEKLIPVLIEEDASMEDKISKAEEILSSVKTKENTVESLIQEAKNKFNLHRDVVGFMQRNIDKINIKPQEDAIQVETTGQVPVLTEAPVSEKVEQGKPQPKAKVVTEEGVQEEVGGDKGSSLAVVVDPINIELKNNKIEGKLFNEQEAKDYQELIESKYNTGSTELFGQEKQDIRQKMFSYDQPLAEKNVNGVNVRITEGLLEGEPYSGDRKKTYLLYADGKVAGKFYSVSDAKKVVNFIEANLVKSLPTQEQTPAQQLKAEKPVVSEETVSENIDPNEIDDEDGDRISAFKVGDIIERGGKKYKILGNSKKENTGVVKLISIDTGVVSDWNAENNGGFKLSKEKAPAQQVEQQKLTESRKGGEVFPYKGEEYLIQKENEGEISAFSIVNKENVPLETIPNKDLKSFQNPLTVSKEVVEKADITKPIIIGDTGKDYFVLDGNHRLTKAMLEGKDIQAYVLTPEQTKKIKLENGKAKKYKTEIPQAEVTAEQQVEQLRAKEQAELKAAIPNADQYLTDGKVDRDKITDAKDLEAFDEIYDKYDKLISPLLPKIETKAEPTPAKPKAEPRLKPRVETRIKFTKAIELFNDISATKGAAKKRTLSAKRRTFLEQNPSIKYIDDNWTSISKQLEDKGLLKKEGNCP